MTFFIYAKNFSYLTYYYFPGWAIYKHIEKKKIAINIYIPKYNLNSKWFYLETWQKSFELLNSKKTSRIPNSKNPKKVILLVE